MHIYIYIYNHPIDDTSYFWQAVYPGRVRVARFKWTGAHVCILGCTWVGWVSEVGGGMAEMDRCLEHESRCYVTGRAREEEGGGGGRGRARLLYTSD